MFNRRDRLSKASLKAVLASGLRRSSTHFSAVMSKDERGLAVVVPKRVARLSVTRHRIKRRVREALKAVRLSTAVVIFPRADSLSMRYDELRSELAKLLS